MCKYYSKVRRKLKDFNVLMFSLLTLTPFIRIIQWVTADYCCLERIHYLINETYI